MKWSQYHWKNKRSDDQRIMNKSNIFNYLLTIVVGVWIFAGVMNAIVFMADHSNSGITEITVLNKTDDLSISNYYVDTDKGSFVINRESTVQQQPHDGTSVYTFMPIYNIEVGKHYYVYYEGVRVESISLYPRLIAWKEKTD